MYNNGFQGINNQAMKTLSELTDGMSKYKLHESINLVGKTIDGDTSFKSFLKDTSLQKMSLGLSFYNDKIQKFSQEIHGALYTENMEKALKTFAASSGFSQEQKNQLYNNILRLNNMNVDKIAMSLSEKMYRNFGERIIWSLYPEDMDEDEKDEAIKTDNIILNEIYRPEPQDIKHNSKIIILPVNDSVLKFLSENPEEFYKIKPREFEEVMAEIYNRLGYDVELTKKTRDGGKDIILRKSDLVGDYIYYVECKQYSSDIAVGIGIVKEFLGTIVSDKPNGGIIATTSFFSRDAQQFVQEEKLNSQIQLHDFNRVQSLLNKSL